MDHHTSSLVTVPLMAGRQNMIIFKEAPNLFSGICYAGLSLMNAFLPILMSREIKNQFACV